MALSPTLDDTDGQSPTDADKPDEHCSSNLQENKISFLGRCMSQQGPRQDSEAIPWRTLRRACPLKNGPSYQGYKTYRVMYITLSVLPSYATCVVSVLPCDAILVGLTFQTLLSCFLWSSNCHGHAESVVISHLCLPCYTPPPPTSTTPVFLGLPYTIKFVQEHVIEGKLNMLL